MPSQVRLAVTIEGPAILIFFCSRGDVIGCFQRLRDQLTEVVAASGRTICARADEELGRITATSAATPGTTKQAIPASRMLSAPVGAAPSPPTRRTTRWPACAASIIAALASCLATATREA